jgi:hypothetical protein
MEEVQGIIIIIMDLRVGEDLVELEEGQQVVGMDWELKLRVK